MKTGLVLEGGAMRGLFTAGVLDVLMENGVECDGLIGVSAGATFGCNYKSKQIGRTLRYNLKYCKDKRYCSFWSLLKTGDIFGRDFCYRRIPFELDVFDNDTFLGNKTEFYVVCSDVDTGKPLYYKYEKGDEHDLEYMRASASMPLVSKIVEVDGKRLLDGGMTDSIPLEYFKSIGYDRCVVVLTQPRDYVKKENGLLPVMRLFLRKYKGLVQAMSCRHEVYNRQKEYVFDCEKRGEVFVIAPEKPLPASRLEHDREKLQATYDLGRKEALRVLEDVKKFLSPT